ncbi:MAG TPA: hypothetical protein VKZ63_14595 [Kofleriaceae bacterium]|nr:hypothetical protein [Kofleriaceae bacterium]
MTDVRILGALLLVGSGAATAYCVWAVYHRGRPADVLYAALAPAAAIIALIGLLLVFVPGFFW